MELQQITIPASVTLLLPIIVTGISHYLRDDGLSKIKNASIASGSIIFIVIATTWLSYNFGIDWRQNVLAAVSVAAALIKDLIALWTYLGAVDSPIAPAVPDNTDWQKKVDSTVDSPILTTPTTPMVAIGAPGTVLQPESSKQA